MAMTALAVLTPFRSEAQTYSNMEEALADSSYTEVYRGTHQ